MQLNASVRRFHVRDVCAVAVWHRMAITMTASMHQPWTDEGGAQEDNVERESAPLAQRRCVHVALPRVPGEPDFAVLSVLPL